MSAGNSSSPSVRTPSAAALAFLSRRQHRRSPALGRAVMARQQLGRRLADLADAERIDQAVERYRAPTLDRLQQVAGRRLAPALALADRRRAAVEAEDVG